jgi:hypothetical protein
MPSSPEKRREQSRRWYANLSLEEKKKHNSRPKTRNAEKAREHRLTYKFGSGSVEYKKSRIVNQVNRCVICFCVLDKACLDHNHETDEWRDVTCDKCNSGLGMFEENISILKSAIAYLKKHALLPGQRVSLSRARDSLVKVRTSEARMLY